MAFTELSSKLNRLGEAAVKRLAYSLKLQKNIASGKLEKSIVHRVSAQSNRISMSIEMEDYWEAVNNGRKAGKRPPLEKIVDWLTYPSVLDKIRGRDELPSGKEILSMAYAIQNKIGKKGTEGSDFANVIIENKKWDDEVREAIDAAIGEDLDKLFDEAFLKDNNGLVKIGNKYVYSK